MISKESIIFYRILSTFAANLKIIVTGPPIIRRFYRLQYHICFSSALDWFTFSHCKIWSMITTNFYCLSTFIFSSFLQWATWIKYRYRYQFALVSLSSDVSKENQNEIAKALFLIVLNSNILHNWQTFTIPVPYLSYLIALVAQILYP